MEKFRLAWLTWVRSCDERRSIVLGTRQTPFALRLRTAVDLAKLLHQLLLRGRVQLLEARVGAQHLLLLLHGQSLVLLEP